MGCGEQGVDQHAASQHDAARNNPTDDRGGGPSQSQNCRTGDKRTSPNSNHGNNYTKNDSQRVFTAPSPTAEHAAKHLNTVARLGPCVRPLRAGNLKAVDPTAGITQQGTGLGAAVLPFPAHGLYGVEDDPLKALTFQGKALNRRATIPPAAHDGDLFGGLLQHLGASIAPAPNDGKIKHSLF
ncbi:hypothetical protein CE91St38_29460 [Desulfovibrionaceae bacterium]|nr:hypothetical protein CE91St38_29460 [Desulfovibrionaceae bacterium]